MNSTLHNTARRFREELLVRDRLAMERMVAAYRPAHNAIQAQLVRITDRIAEAQAAGQPLGRSWLFQQSRAEQLEAQIQGAVRSFVPQAERIVLENQRYGVSKAMADSRDLVSAALPPQNPSLAFRWDVLPRSAVEGLVGFTADGSPLRSLLDELGPRTSRAIRDELATGLSLGRNPQKVAKLVRARSGMALARAMTISRTEMLRSYREATRQSYERSSVVQGWIWLSARQLNTCAACWARDGERFANADVMPVHPNCRCTMVPDTGDTDVGSGPDLFDKLPVSSKKRILGPSKFQALDEGRIELADLVSVRRSREWGKSTQVASLTTALAKGSRR